MAKKQPFLATRRPSRRSEREATTITEGQPIRISFRVHPATHKALKLRATEKGQSIKGFLLDLMRESGISVQE
jgi:hypothetical protein